MSRHPKNPIDRKMPQPLRLLLVEDNIDDALLVERSLKKAGYDTLHIERVDNYFDLITKMQQKWDLVISDYRLPQFTGEEALKIVRDIDPDLPFILVSGYVGEDIAVKVMKAGANDYIMKNNLTRLGPAVDREIHETQVRRDWRKAEEEIRKLSLVARHTSNGVLFTDTDGYIEWVNKGFYEMTGYSLKEVKGKKLGALQGKETDHETLSYINKQIKNKTPFTCEILNYHKTGKPLWLDMICQPIYNENQEITNFFAIQIDITGRKMAEEHNRKLNEELERRVQERTELLEGAYKELEAFGYSISHDLKAPLRHITMYSQLLQKSLLDKITSEENDLLEVVIASSVKMNKLIEGLLHFSKVGNRMINVKDVDTNKMAEQVVQSVQSNYPQKKEIILRELPIVLADEILLQQVFENLTGNAFKYSSKREEIIIEIGHYENDNHHIFYVKDNGTGFDMQFADKLFNTFQRLHSDEDFEGIGIGLAIAKKIVERHGGRIWANAVPGEGATFYFSISNTF